MSLLSEDFLIWHNGVPLIVVVNDTEFAVWINQVPFEDQQTIGAALAVSRVDNRSVLTGTMTAVFSLAGRSDSYAFIKGTTPPILFAHSKCVTATKLTGHMVATGRMRGKSVNYTSVEIENVEEVFSAKSVNYTKLRGRLVGVGGLVGKTVSYTKLRETGFIGIVPPVGTTFKMLSMSALSGTLIGVGALRSRIVNFSTLKPHLTALGQLHGFSFSADSLRALLLGIAPIDGRADNFFTLSLDGRLIGLGGLVSRVVNYTAASSYMVGFGHMFGLCYSNFWWANRVTTIFVPAVPIVISPALPRSLLDDKSLKPGYEFKRRMRNIKWPAHFPVPEIVRSGTPPKAPASYRFYMMHPLSVSRSALSGLLVDGTIIVAVNMSGRSDSATVTHAVGSRFLPGPLPPTAPRRGPRVGPPYRLPVNTS